MNVKTILITEEQKKRLFLEKFEIDKRNRTVKWIDDNLSTNNTNYRNYEITTNDLILKPWHIFLEQSGLSCYCLYNFKDIALQKLIKKNGLKSFDDDGNEMFISFDWDRENKDAFLKHSSNYAALLLTNLVDRIKSQYKEYDDKITLKYIAYPQSSSKFNKEFTENYLKPYLIKYFPDVEVKHDMFLKNYDSQNIGVNEELAKAIGCSQTDLMRIRKYAIKCDVNKKLVPIRKSIENLLRPILKELEENNARQNYQWNITGDKNTKNIQKLYKTDTGLYFDADNKDYDEDWVKPGKERVSDQKSNQHALLYHFNDKLHDNNKSLTVLWLDDNRNPETYFTKPSEGETWDRNDRFYYRLENKYDINFVWVKTFKEFMDYVENNPLPDMVSYDYDLDEFKESETAAKQRFEIEQYGGAKSDEIIEWFISYCKENSLRVPDFYIHSANARNRMKIYDKLKKGVIDTMPTEEIDEFYPIQDAQKTDFSRVNVELTQNKNSSKHKTKIIDRDVYAITQSLYKKMIELQKVYGSAEKAWEDFQGDVKHYESLEGYAKYLNQTKQSSMQDSSNNADAKEDWEIKSWPNFVRRVLTNLFITDEKVLETIHKEDMKTKIIVIFDDNVAGGSSLDKTCCALEGVGWNYIIPLSLSLMPVGGQGEHERKDFEQRENYLKRNGLETEEEFYKNTRFQMPFNISDPSKDNQLIRNRREVTYSPMNKAIRPQASYNPETFFDPSASSFKGNTKSKKKGNSTKSKNKDNRTNLINSEPQNH